jgi:hypothetical protein
MSENSEQYFGTVNSFLPFVSNRHGKFYASFAVMRDDTVVCVPIMGPYKTDRKASGVSAKWTRLNSKLMDSGQGLSFVDMKTVPDDVRAYITESITAAIGRGVITHDTPANTIFGKAFH